MVDFAALLRKTPEEREADRVKHDAEYALKTKECIESRRLMLDELDAVSGRLTPWERKFLASIRHKEMTYDPISGVQGGELNYLSSSQVEVFNRIHAANAATPQGVTDDAQTTSRTMSRSERFRVSGG